VKIEARIGARRQRKVRGTVGAAADDRVGAHDFVLPDPHDA